MDSISQISTALQHTLSIQQKCEGDEKSSSSVSIAEERMPTASEVEAGTGNDGVNSDVNSMFHYGVCAICLNKINLQETALIKGCEHAYCVNCILRWASCKKEPTCPQCKHPFEFLNVHRSLDGSIHDYMFEESVCLLLRATWFVPLSHIEEITEVHDDMEYLYQYVDEEDDDMDEVYYSSSSSLRIGNRRWGDNGYVRAGRQEARPVYRPSIQDSGGAGSSRQSTKKETSQVNVGRRAKRALKREAADKAAAEKHEQHLVRFGRK